MENKHASLAVVVILALCGYSYILSRENKVLVNALLQSNSGFTEFMNKSVKGKKLYEYINPDSVVTFKIDGQSFACATLLSPLPAPPPKK